MDYLASHPWVVVVGAAAIGVGVWWWLSQREKFILGRVKALLGRKKAEPSEPKISGPYNTQPHVSDWLVTPRDYDDQMKVPGSSPRIVNYLDAFAPPKGWTREGGYRKWYGEGPEAKNWGWGYW